MRDLHLHLHAAGLATVAAVLYLEAPVSIYSSISAPDSSPRHPASGVFCQSSGRNNAVRGVCVGGHFGCCGS